MSVFGAFAVTLLVWWPPRRCVVVLATASLWRHAYSDSGAHEVGVEGGQPNDEEGEATKQSPEASWTCRSETSQGHANSTPTSLAEVWLAFLLCGATLSVASGEGPARQFRVLPREASWSMRS